MRLRDLFPIAGPALLCAGLCGACAEPDPAPADAPPPTSRPVEGIESPPPRQKVAGLWGLEAWTRVEFPDLPDDPHRLQTLLGFPARTRWMLAPEVNPLGNVRIVYEYGERLFVVEPGTPDSLELVGDALREQVRNMALRRALFVPEALAWQELEDGRRRADLGPAGSLEAEGPTARPARIDSFSAAGETSLSLTSIAWPEAARDGRAWPASWELRQGNQVLWTETLERAEPVDAVFTRAFLPRDRREGEATTAGEPEEGRRGPGWALEVPLPQDADWDEAEARAELAVQAELAAGRAVQVPAPLTLRPDGRPSHVRLVLPPEARPAAPWREQAESSLLELRWSGSEFPAPARVREALERLRERAAATGRRVEGAATLGRLPGEGGFRLTVPLGG